MRRGKNKPGVQEEQSRADRGSGWKVKACQRRRGRGAGGCIQQMTHQAESPPAKHCSFMRQVTAQWDYGPGRQRVWGGTGRDQPWQPQRR